MADPSKPEPKPSAEQGGAAASESDVGQLAALFAAQGGGRLSAEVSADLALEIVLNEIVEQACLATGATGAAIVLLRDGEMVCRASSGVNAPELGARLGGESGLTAECIQTRRVQRCDDAQTDPRADAEASRSLGVRSVLILPLLRDGELAGVLEVFSSRAGAFGERDELTLQALANRTLKNLDRARETFLGVPSNGASAGVATVSAPVPAARPVEPAAPVTPVAASEWKDSLPGFSISRNRHEERDFARENAGPNPQAGFDVVTFFLCGAVLICAVSLGTLVGLRLGWLKATAARAHVTRSISRAAAGAQSGVTPNGAAQSSTAQSGSAKAGEPESGASSPTASSGSGNAQATKDAASTAAVRPSGAFPPPGGLSVYENGKEVFRLPPASGSTGVVEVSQKVAEGNLLHRVEPEYPAEARQRQMQGAVVLDVRIGRDGAVQDAKLVSGESPLASAAIAAVKQWRFKPRTQQGQPVEMQTRVTLNFKLPG
jgi:TonB family protein